MTNRMIKHQFLYINLIDLIIKVQGINMVLFYNTNLKINVPNIYKEISKISIKSGSNESSFAESFDTAFLPSSIRHFDGTIK